MPNHQDRYVVTAIPSSITDPDCVGAGLAALHRSRLRHRDPRTLARRCLGVRHAADGSQTALSAGRQGAAHRAGISPNTRR